MKSAISVFNQSVHVSSLAVFCLACLCCQLVHAEHEAFKRKEDSSLVTNKRIQFKITFFFQGTLIHKHSYTNV